jgi:AcrR family transcriptional regulator
MSKRKYTSTANLKDYISESLMLLMRKKGFEDISIGEITDRAGVNRSSYYRNFNSKEEVIKHYFNKIIYEFIEKIKDGKGMALNEYLVRMFTHFYQYKKELLLLYKNKLSHLILDALTETFTVIRKQQAFEDMFKTYYHTGGIYNCFLLWFSDEMRVSPEKMAELSCGILPKGYKPALVS